MIKGHLSPHGCVLLELDISHGSALRVTAAVMLGAVVDMEVKNRRIRKKGLYRVFFGKAIETFWRNQLASTIQNLNTRRMSTTEIIKSCLDLGKAKLNTYFGEINWEAHAKT